MRSLKQFLKNIPWTQVIIILCLSLGAFLRLWNFPNNLQFLGDQGRDAIIAKRILIDHDPALIGPVTSTGNMYLGPFYYYFMVPFLALSYPSPIGPAYAVAIFSIITIGLIYYLGRQLVGERPALIATVLAAFANSFVYFGRFSWNPNISPFVSIILVWATYKAFSKNPWYWAVVGLCLAILVQLHYITLLCIPAAGIIWLVQLKRYIDSARNKKQTTLQKESKSFAFGTVLAIAIFLLSFAPLVLFDFRHNFINSQSFIHFVTADLGPNQSSLIDRARLIITRLFLRANQTLFQEFIWSNIFASTAALVALVVTLFNLLKKTNQYKPGLLIILTYIGVSVLGLGYYRGAIFSHYFIYLFPFSILLWGVVLDTWLRTKVGKVLFLAVCITFFIWNFSEYAIFKPTWSIEQIQAVDSTILGRLHDKDKYNIILLSGTGDIEGQNYRYFLDVSSHPPLAQADWGTVDTLFIINEDHKLKNVVDSPIYEIVVFPNKSPAQVYTVPGGPEITVLRR